MGVVSPWAVGGASHTMRQSKTQLERTAATLERVPDPVTLSAPTSDAPSRLFVGRALRYVGGIVAFGALLFFRGVGCPFATAFHVACPACGSTRAVRALVHGDVAAALRFNPIAPLVAGALAALAVRLALVVLREGSPRSLAEGRPGRALVAVLVGAVTVQILVWGLRLAGYFGGPLAV